MWREYITAANLSDAIMALNRQPDTTRIIAGGTDLMLEMGRGVKKGIDTLVDISRVPGLAEITLDGDNCLHLGALVTHNTCVASKLIRELARPLAQAAWQVGSPQIRNRGTVAGNLITASPANDTIAPLMALNAVLTLRSTTGERNVPIADFYLGVRRTVMQPGEMLVDVAFPALKSNQWGVFIKFALRRAQAISLVNTAIVLTLNGDIVTQAVITLGAVAPTIVHAKAAEEYLVGKKLDEKVIAEAAQLAVAAARPISDVRGSAGYRRHMVNVIVQRGLRSLWKKTAEYALPENPVLLWGKEHNAASLKQSVVVDQNTAIETTINGQAYRFEGGHGKTLLRLLREDALLTGTKEGCAEGECGACTVFLDGIAVMGCMIPAERAHGAVIQTVEGLAEGDVLHPVQAAFVKLGAVQCGYCTPGFIMSTVKLLEERTSPTRNEIRQALTGNLCRCTGYYQIIEAVEQAAQGG